jgi:hypothetical protein
VIYRLSSYVEPKPQFVQVSASMFVKRVYIKNISPTGLVTFTDGTTLVGDLNIMVREGLL